MKLGRYDTDASALTVRISAHKKYGSRDFNRWVFECLDPTEGQRILDLGCGTGNQTLPLAELVGEAGRVVALDISGEALGMLSKQAKALGLGSRITILQCSLDVVETYLGKYPSFDRALASYSLYYADHPALVLQAIHRLLEPGGVLFFCGPSKNNNAELKSFLHRLEGIQTKPEGEAVRFMEETGPSLSEELFSQVETFTFENPLKFDSAEALYQYWHSHNMFDEKLEEAFRVSVGKHFSEQSFFQTTKHVLGVRARK